MQADFFEDEGGAGKQKDFSSADVWRMLTRVKSTVLPSIPVQRAALSPGAHASSPSASPLCTPDSPVCEGDEHEFSDVPSMNAYSPPKSSLTATKSITSWAANSPSSYFSKKTKTE